MGLGKPGHFNTPLISLRAFQFLKGLSKILHKSGSHAPKK
jgi:hypothetical protein